MPFRAILAVFLHIRSQQCIPLGEHIERVYIIYMLTVRQRVLMINFCSEVHGTMQPSEPSLRRIQRPCLRPMQERLQGPEIYARQNNNSCIIIVCRQKQVVRD